MKVIFIASSLPALFLLNNRNLFLKSLIVFKNKELSLNFDQEVIKTNMFYFDQTLTGENIQKFYCSENQFITFHECCWDKLDELIIKKNIKTEFYPVSSLNACIDLRKENIFKIIKDYGFSIVTLKSYVKYRIDKFSKGNSFLYYLMPDDGGNNDFYLIRSLNQSFLKNIELNKNAYGFKNLEGNSKKSNQIVFLIGTDVVDDNLLISIFNHITLFCHNNKIKFIVKFHPRANKNFINQFRIKEADIFEKQIPFEISNIEYRYKISLFSTSLIFEPNKSISLEKIIEKKLDKSNMSKFNLRKKHLRSFSDFEKIIIPPSLNNLYDLLK